MAAHDERIAAIRAAVAEANARMVARLEQMDDASATRNPADGWNAAQIGVHTALTTEFLSGVLAGGVPDMEAPRTGDFTEQLATLAFPERVKTFPALEPSADATRADAIARLKASGATFASALGAATAERCGSTVVNMPFGAAFSVYEVGEFIGGHIQRHMGQLDRTVGA